MEADIDHDIELESDLAPSLAVVGRPNMSLPILQASRWVRFLSSGRNRPGLVGCDVMVTADDQEFVIKLQSGEGGVQLHAPVCESVTAQFASDLGIPIADSVLIEITPDFVSSIVDPEAKRRCAESLGLNFGTRYLGPGFVLLSAAVGVPAACMPTMAEIYFFDAIVQNHDRLPRNSNILLNGTDLRAIDHEMGYALLEITAPDYNRPESCFGWANHVFHQPLKGSGASLTRICSAFSALKPSRFQHYVDCLPDEWAGKRRYSQRILDHLNYAQASHLGVSSFLSQHFLS